MEHAGDQKQIFQIADQLKFPLSLILIQISLLLTRFFYYFTEKIWKIRKGFDIVDNWGFEEPKTAVQHMTSFEPTFIHKAPSKSCELDPVPTSLLREIC